MRSFFLLLVAASLSLPSFASEETKTWAETVKPTALQHVKLLYHFRQNGASLAPSSNLIRFDWVNAVLQCSPNKSTWQSSRDFEELIRCREQLATLLGPVDLDYVESDRIRNNDESVAQKRVVDLIDYLDTHPEWRGQMQFRVRFQHVGDFRPSVPI